MPETPNYYATLPATVRYSEKISAAAKLLYAEISALCNKEGYCWATNKYFADIYKLDARSVSRLIAELKENNFIRYTIDRGEQRRITILELKAIENQGGMDKNVYTPRQINPETIDKIVLQNNIININTINNNTVDMLITYVNYQFLRFFKRKASEQDVDNFVNNCRKYSTARVIQAFTDAFKDNVSTWAYIEAKLKKQTVKKEISQAADKKIAADNLVKSVISDEEAAETAKVFRNLLDSMQLPKDLPQTASIDKRGEKKKAAAIPKYPKDSQAYEKAKNEFQEQLRKERGN